MPKISVANIDTHLKNYKYVKPRPNIKLQWGPSCGLYALAEVINKQTRGGETKTIPARKHDIKGYTKPSLRQIAKEEGMTDVGPMFNSFDLVKLAWGQGMGAELVHVSTTNFKNKIEFHVNKNRMLLVPFDVGDSGDPTYKDGQRAHWCIVFGYSDSGKLGHTVVANHWGGYFSWKTADLARSCDQLQEDPRGLYEKLKLQAKHHARAVAHYGLRNKDGKPIKVWSLGKRDPAFKKGALETLDADKQNLNRLRNRLVAITAR